MAATENPEEKVPEEEREVTAVEAEDVTASAEDIAVSSEEFKLNLMIPALKMLMRTAVGMSSIVIRVTKTRCVITWNSASKRWG